MLFYSNFEHTLFTSAYISDLPTKLIREVIENRHVCKKFRLICTIFIAVNSGNFFLQKSQHSIEKAINEINRNLFMAQTIF